MKEKIKISISKPCSEDWKNLKIRSNGRFCGSCQKNVIDFTKMTEAEIASFFKKKPSNTCGRFHPFQLKEMELTNAKNVRSNSILGASLLSVFLAFFSNEAVSQEVSKEKTELHDSSVRSNQRTKNTENYRVKGRVKDYTGESLPGVNIVLKRTTSGTTTDLDGEFIFPLELHTGDILVVSFVGFDTIEHEITNDDLSRGELHITLDSFVGFMGEIAVEGVYQPKHNTLKKVWGLLTNFKESKKY
jgi:hypothetical protein